MKILFLTPRFPYPPLKGEQLRAYNFIKLLSQRGHEIFLLSFGDKNDELHIPRLRKYCGQIKLIRLSLAEKALNFVKCFISRYPMQLFPFFSKKMSAEISCILEDNKIDLAQIELVRMAHFSGYFKKTPVVLDLVDCLALNMQRRHQKEKHFKKAAFYLEWGRMKRYEDHILSGKGRFLVVSNAEKKALGGKNNIDVIPVGIDVPKAASPLSKKMNKIIFTGNMSYFPNKNAVKHFIKHIFPLIKKEIPSAEFHIVGANPPKKILSLHNGKDIFVHGFVENMSDHIRTSCVAVAPLTTGTGIQIKVLEAMACEVPVVATSCAVQGIDCENGKHVLVADEPKAFAQRVIELMKNEAERIKLASKALQLIKDEYNWTKITDKLTSVYHSVLAR